MVQSLEPFRYDFWHSEPPELVKCLFFMPNGVAIQMNFPKESVFREIKEVRTKKRSSQANHNFIPFI
jgi:hypothetical protein